MLLNLVEPNLNYPIIRLVSENKKWEVGVFSVLYGVRVGANQIGDGIYSKGGYCCGQNSNLTLLVLLAMIHLVEEQNEDITTNEFEELLPNWSVRPIDRDTELLNEFLSISTKERHRPGICSMKGIIDGYMNLRFEA